MQITPIKAVTSITAPAPSSAESLKLERSAALPHLIVARRQDPDFEDLPGDTLDRAGKDKKAVEKAAENVNKLMGLIDKKLEFAVHDKTRRTMIQVVHSDSGRVLSEFPSERMLDLYASLVEAIGIVVDEKI
ncbi:MAG: flagellar protein FlaG [Gracilibacteraceae bacterium]|jgi:flagellar protein FlaG|nr:flagellar protein FlaG [Gracilibacteraceae bacterium]